MYDFIFVEQHVFFFCKLFFWPRLLCLGQFLKNEGIKNVSFIGRYKDFYIEGFSDPISAHLKKEQFEAEWKIIRSNYKFIFVKASRSLQLESLMSIV